MKYGQEFREIGHCGGSVVLNLKTVEGQRKLSFGYRHVDPTPISLFAVYALPQGAVISACAFTGIGGQSRLPTPDAWTVFIASDSHGMFGRKCQKCDGYWRAASVTTYWKMTCPYCGFREESHHFTSDGQRKYVSEYCEYILDSLQHKPDGAHVINMNEIAQAAAKSHEKPKFYYAEESQQNKFKCSACNDYNDILGRYQYVQYVVPTTVLKNLARKYCVSGIRSKPEMSTKYV